MSDHLWRLVAPWYRWPLPAGAAHREGRGSAPTIQKYDDAKFVDAFMRAPQHSLRYVDDDHVFRLVAVSDTVTSGPNAGRRRRLATAVPMRTDTRKLFLATHKRFYLVVCELHCDAPGFPRVNREAVCEAGLVVRRRIASYPASAEAGAVGIVKRINGLQAELTDLEHPDDRRVRRRMRRSTLNGDAAADPAERRRQIGVALEKARAELRRWAASSGAGVSAQGWIPSGVDGIGAWADVGDEVQSVDEQVTPLFPLVPDPRDPGHDGQGCTMYFGVLPTASSDADSGGVPRFDDDALYEARCFVRRHRPECPRTGEPNDCHGELVWSRPTDPYRLAPAMDLDGTANRPVTIKLPDFKQLAAQALAKPQGSVRFVAPPGSSLTFGVSGGMPTGGGVLPGGLTCFWAIPLITIVAYFLLNLFLPIVVLVFGLWWMLLLKFCSLPAFSLNADIAANLTAGIDLDVGLSASAVATARAELKADLDAHLGSPSSGPSPSARADSDNLANQPIAEFQSRLANPPGAPDFTAGLEWEAEVEREPVEVAP